MTVLAPNDSTTNFAIVAEGKDIRVHKIVLTAQSPFLAQFLTADPSCCRINANNARYDAMNVIVKIMYFQHFEGMIVNDTNSIISSSETFFVPYRYDFSVLLSAWEIAMHFQMMRLAKMTCVPLLLPLMSSYTSVRALRSCLKHPHDEGALEIRTNALCFIPPLLDTADQIAEWKTLQEKYPFLTVMINTRQEEQLVKPRVNPLGTSFASEIDARGIQPLFAGTARSTAHQLSQLSPIHSEQQIDAGSNHFSDLSKDPHLLSMAIESSRVPCHSNLGVQQPHHHYQQHQDLNNSSYATLMTPSSFIPNVSSSRDQHNNFNNTTSHTNYPLSVLHTTNTGKKSDDDNKIHDSFTFVEPPPIKLVPLKYNREPYLQTVRELEATLASLRGDYHEGTKEWKREEEHLNYLLENIESQDSDVAEVIQAASASDKDAQRLEFRISELVKENAIMEKSIADNLQYLESSLVYVPSAQEACVLLTKNLDSISRQLAHRGGRSRSQGAGGSDVRSMLKILLNEMKADKQEMTKELQEQQRLSEGLNYHAQQEKEKASALRGQLVAMGR